MRRFYSTPSPCLFELFSQISSHLAVFFSHNKPANSTFSYNKPAKPTGRVFLMGWEAAIHDGPHVRGARAVATEAFTDAQNRCVSSFSFLSFLFYFWFYHYSFFIFYLTLF
jgi:hypothetical protein